jgi:cysteine synthase A
MAIAENITEIIGNTPILRVNSLSKNILAKCEFKNPGGSVKDRIAFNMINEALKSGKIDKNTTIIEPTSGNTGIGLAMVCASMGLKLILTMPESMSIERRKILKAYGAKLELTPASEGMAGTLTKAKELNEKIENSVILGQFENPANPQIHRVTTALEILRDTDGKVDIFVAAIGTGGTITGVGEVLKSKIDGIKIVAVEPSKSAILSGEKPAPHKIQGIGANFIPKILNQEVYDEIITVDDEEAMKMSRFVAKHEGLLVGISSGANLVAAKELSNRYPDKTVLTMLPDTGERYLSGELFEE